MGDRIRMLRKGRNLTQLVVATRLGVTKALISAYENGTALPSYDVLLGFANLFNVTTDYLIGKEKTVSLSTKGLTESQMGLVAALVSEFQVANGTNV